jgi:hypothetical protein
MDTHNLIIDLTGGMSAQTTGGTIAREGINTQRAE